MIAQIHAGYGKAGLFGQEFQQVIPQKFDLRGGKIHFQRFGPRRGLHKPFVRTRATGLRRGRQALRDLLPLGRHTNDLTALPLQTQIQRDIRGAVCPHPCGELIDLAWIRHMIE